MSTRALTSGMVTQVEAGTLAPIFLYEGVFTGGTLRIWTGFGYLDWNGQQWAGAGTLLTISILSETTELRATGMEVSLSGMPSSLIATVLAHARYGKPGTLYFGAIDSSGIVVADPYIAFRGRLDLPNVVDSGERCVIRVTYESSLIDLQRPRIRNYTPHDQQLDHPSDLGFEFVAGLQDRNFTWGLHVTPATGGGTGAPVAAPPPVSSPANPVEWYYPPVNN